MTKHSPNLEVLAATNAQIEEVDLSQNLLLRRAYLSDNNLKKQLFSPDMTQLGIVDCDDNNLSACALDGLYNSLPSWNGTAADNAISTLFNRGVKADELNQAETSNTDIATYKNWKPAALGDGSGCTKSVKEITIGNGFNYYSIGGKLIVVLDTEYANAQLTLYDMEGRMVAQSQEHGTLRAFTLGSGSYLLYLQNTVVKILIP